MKIVIVGCGKLGFALARQLSEEKHDVTVIDLNGENSSVPWPSWIYRG